MVVQSFTWFVDLSTSADTVQVISITAGGNPVKNRLMPFFTAYKYFKLGGVSVKFCPASTLPVDPTGLSYEVGENTVDPRDQFNPGLIRITNGEDFYLDATALSSANADAVYYNMMLDKRWFKFQLQAGTKRYAKPLFWSIAQAHQDNYPGITVNYPKFNDALGHSFENVSISTAYNDEAALVRSVDWDNSDPRGFFQTGRKERVGYLPTDAFQTYPILDEESTVASYGLNSVPEIDLMKIVLPRAYKTKYYYRVYITETVYFKEPVVNNYNGFTQLDRFVRPNYLTGSPDSASSLHWQQDSPHTVIPNNQGDGKVI